MPRPHSKLSTNTRVSVSSRYIKTKEVIEVLEKKYELNAVALAFQGTTGNRVMINGNVGYEVKLDVVPAITMTLPATCIKYLASENNEPSNVSGSANSTANVPESSFEEIVEPSSDEDSEEEVDLTLVEGGVAGEVFIDNRIQEGDGFRSTKAKMTMQNPELRSPVDYFLFFLPLDHFYTIIMNINENARNTLGCWKDVTLPEYLMWIAIISVMAVIPQWDIKAFWNSGNSHFRLSIDCNKYMSFNRFRDIKKMHVFEVPSLSPRFSNPSLTGQSGF